jgi:uncharacterized protein YjbI with pentapeptide repeats
MAQDPNPFNVDALERSLNDSATRVSTVWISLLGFGLYLVVAAGAVTDRQLLLKDPVRLPALNVDLPLRGFFFLTPILFVIFHTYVLIQVLLLARTAAAYNNALDRTVRVSIDNATMRERLANTLFAQIFAGAPRERGGWVGRLLRLIAWITLAIAPVLVLLVFQFRFLPYHSHGITWTIRLLILFDLIGVLLLWRAARRPDHDLSWRLTLQGCLAWLFATALAAFSWVVLTFPGEPHAQWTRFESRDKWPLGRIELEQWPGRPLECQTPSPLDAVFAFDRVSLPELDVVDPEKLAKMKARTHRVYAPSEQKHTQSFDKRDLTCAYLWNADLRRVNLSSARLRGADLTGADLEGADLVQADLEGAKLNYATLNDGNLFSTDLRNALMESANLIRADLGSARLQGASLKEAQLYGAQLVGVGAQGADLSDAKLEGARLWLTQLQGASLNRAHLQFAQLRGAQLQGADLRGADLSAAYLESVGLQGAALSETAMQYSRVLGLNVWRAKITGCTNVLLGEHVSSDAVLPPIPDPDQGPPYPEIYPNPIETIPANSDNIASFIEKHVVRISNGEKKQAAIDRMQRGLADPTKEDTAAIEDVWRKCVEASQQVSRTDFAKQRVGFQLDLFCETKKRVCDREVYCDAKKSVGAVANSLLDIWLPPRERRTNLSRQLAQGMLDTESCAASEVLDDETKARLRDHNRPSRKSE